MDYQLILKAQIKSDSSSLLTVVKGKHIPKCFQLLRSSDIAVYHADILKEKHPLRMLM